MSIADLASYQAKLLGPHQLIHQSKTTVTTVAARSFTNWATGVPAGAAPTTPAVPTSATAGAVGQLDGLGTLRIGGVEVSFVQGGCLLLCDRLSHQGGLDGNSAAEQTTNLPTAALTRYTDGVGVHASIDIHTVIGATPGTVVLKYTNQAGTANQLSPATVLGGSGFATVQRSIDIPLALGDTGIRSVESYTGPASGTVGAVGVTLYKPLLMLPLPANGGQQFNFDALLSCCGNLPEILPGACLYWRLWSVTTTTGVIATTLRFIED